MTSLWKIERAAVASLQLDGHNPRFEIGSPNPSQADLVRLLFHQHDAMDIAKSIARGGFFANEPLLGIKEGNQLVVVEGNRRLAALKALRNPKLLEGAQRKAVENLVKKMPDPGIRHDDFLHVGTGQATRVARHHTDVPRPGAEDAAALRVGGPSHVHLHGRSSVSLDVQGRVEAVQGFAGSACLEDLFELHAKPWSGCLDGFA